MFIYPSSVAEEILIHRHACYLGTVIYDVRLHVVRVFRIGPAEDLCVVYPVLPVGTCIAARHILRLIWEASFIGNSVVPKIVARVVHVPT